MNCKLLIMGALLCDVMAMEAQTADVADSLTMEKMMHSLPEVMIKGSRPIVKAERGMLSYNMPQLLKQLPADNAYEALTRIPGISDADGSLKFSGNGVTLIINGQATTLTQEQLTDRLKALPAKEVAKAEVMLSAPARYHVRGMAINIVTKAHAGERLLSGQIAGSWQQSRYGLGFGKGYLNIQRGKFGMDVQYSFRDGSSYSEVSHEANHPLGGNRIAYYDKTWKKSFGIAHNYRLGMNYAFAKNHRLDLSYTGTWSKYNANNHTTGTGVAEQHSDSHTYMHNVDADYSLPFGLRLNASYTYYRMPQEQLLDGKLFTGGGLSGTSRNLATHSRQTIRKWAFAADQNHSLSHGWGLSYGLKAQFATNNSFQTTLDKLGNVVPGASSSVDISERIWNVYAGFSKQLTKRLSLEASLAAEQYHSLQWNEWHIYPSLNALWNINDNHILNLSFSSNTEFPSYWSTMSSIFYPSAYSEIWGNPNLKPYSYYNVNLMWQFKRHYTLMAFASLKPDYSVQLPYQTTDRMAVIMKETNFDFDRTFGLQASAMFTVGKWLSGNAFIVGQCKHDKSSHFFDLPFDRKKFRAIFGSTTSIKLCHTQDLRLILNPFFQTKSIQGVYDISPVFMLNADLRWASTNDKWNLRINGSNIFNHQFDTRSVQGNQDYRMKVGQQWASGTITVIYKFGGYKEMKVKGVDTSRMGH